jgi:large subunit ribosomal protein L10
VIRADKVELVERMQQEFARAPHVVLATFNGLKVNQDATLRAKVRGTGGRYRVIKNRLAKRAAAGSAVEKILDRLTGPCGLAMHPADPVALVRALDEFCKENPEVVVVAAVIDGRTVLDGADVKRLASLPSLEQLRSQLLALVQTPATQLVRLLATPGQQLARAVDARREKLEG